jgi:Heterokaryon incompatibility protein (HET)
MDAGCIIQDSLQDWLKETPVMTKVYASPAVGLAAIAAKNADRGLLFD